MRFGGWQAKWLASIVMMTGEQHPHDSGIMYTRQIENLIELAPSRIIGNAGRWRTSAEAIVYIIGIVDIEEEWLRMLVPDEKKRDHLLKGNEREFFAE